MASGLRSILVNRHQRIVWASCKSDKIDPKSTFQITIRFPLDRALKTTLGSTTRAWHLLRYRSINQCENVSMIISGQFVPFFPKKRRNLNDLFHYQTIYKLSIQRKRVYRKGNQAFYLIARLLGITTEYGVPKIKSNGLFCLFSFRVFMFFLIFCINCR